MSDRTQPWAQTPTGNVLQSIALDVSGGDHTPADLPNGFHCNTSGNIVGQLKDDDEDGTFAVVAGAYYPYRFAVVRQTDTTAEGRFLYTV